MRALSIRQPFAELILRGVKTAEVRSRPTRVIGERFWIYASKSRQKAVGGRQKEGKTGVWSLDLAMPGGELPGVILELAEELIGADLPRGVIVGSAVMMRVYGRRRTRWLRRAATRGGRHTPA